METGKSFEQQITEDLLTRIKSENSFLVDLENKLKDPNFELTAEDSEILEKIRDKYRPEMKRLLDNGEIGKYNKIADLLILPNVFG